MSTLNIVTRHEELLADRQQAAELLNAQLSDYLDREVGSVVVLGIPRGGVILADKIARHFHAQLDVVLTRKVRAPHNPELAVGAVTEDGQLYTNQPIITSLGLSDDYIEQEKNLQFQTIRQRQERYRRVLDKTPLRDKVVVLTDDGAATGATMQAALWATAAESPRRVILALPVAPPDALRRLAEEADDTVCLCSPSNFRAISQFYTCFEQVEDDEVIRVLHHYSKPQSREQDMSE